MSELDLEVLKAGRYIKQNIIELEQTIRATLERSKWSE